VTDAGPDDARGDARERGVRTALVLGPLFAVIGIAWTAAAPSFASQSAVLVGLLTCVWATHRFGRLGPDADEASAKAGPKKRA
jgi:hypothetical protein